MGEYKLGNVRWHRRIAASVTVVRARWGTRNRMYCGAIAGGTVIWRNSNHDKHRETIQHTTPFRQKRDEFSMKITQNEPMMQSSDTTHRWEAIVDFGRMLRKKSLRTAIHRRSAGIVSFGDVLRARNYRTCHTYWLARTLVLHVHVAGTDYVLDYTYIL